MKRYLAPITFAFFAILAGCSSTVPRELSSAREAYRRASTGHAARVAPAKLHVANQALAKAEVAYQDDPESYRARDLAYVAERKAELAEVAASIALAKKSKVDANNEYQSTQGKLVSETKQDLSETRNELAASERSGQRTAERLSEEQKARSAADERAASALAKLAAVKEDSRGTIITLSGSVLFASNRSTLLPDARTRLDQVAAVLLDTRERNIVIEGHTDSRGSDRSNLELSQQRADAVRNYLVQRDYQADRIQARGLGETQPVAGNTSAEGRANNRRVEIIIERESRTSSR